MIKRVRFQGVGSLLDVDVKLGPLTLLLGPNASGKTMFLTALGLLSRVIRQPIRGPMGELKIGPVSLDDLVFRHDPSRPIRIEVWIDNDVGEPNYSLELAKENALWSVRREDIQWRDLNYRSTEPYQFNTERRGRITLETPGEPPRHGTLPFLVYPYRADGVAAKTIRPLLELQAAIGYVYFYHVNPVSVTNSFLPSWIKPDKLFVDTTGLGFSQALRDWKQSIPGGKAFMEKVLPELRKLFPHIVDVGSASLQNRVATHYQTNRALNPIPATLESDGVNLALFYLTIAHLVAARQAVPPQETPLCLCLEEPESGTHPRLQRQRLELLRSIAQGGILGRPVQVIATTHSVDMVRWATKDEAVNVFRFVEHLGPDKGSSIHQLSSTDQLDKIYQAWEGDLGAAWYSGALGPGPQIPSQDE